MYRKTCSIFTAFLLSTAPNLYAATEMPSRFAQPAPESNEVTVNIDEPVAEASPSAGGEPAAQTIPEIAVEEKKSETKPVEIIEKPPAPQLLGSASESTPIEKKTEAPTLVLPVKPVDVSPPAKDDSMEVSVAPEKDSLREALAYVYQHHPQLLAERERVKAIDESVAQAVSDFRPDIQADYNKGRERTSTGNSPWSYGDTKSKGLIVTQPIFSGLDGVANLKSAKQRVKAARADLTALEQQLLYNAVVAYTGVAEAQSVLLLNQNNVDVLGKQRDAAQARYDVGEITKTDVSQAEARLAVAKSNEQQSLGDVAIARANFVRAVGYPAPDKITLPEVPANLPKDMSEASQMAQAASPVLDAAKHREKAFESDVNVRVGAILPDISLQGSMRRSEGGNVFSNTYDNDALTLNLTIPLYQSGAEWSRLREARNVATQARFDTLDTTLAVEQDVTNAWQNFITADSVIVSSEAAAKASGLALEGVRQENEFGVRTVLDVLDAEQEYMNTKVNLVRALRLHKIQAYRLLASVGKLTADELSLPVKIYDPKDNYNDVKYQLLGW